MRLKHYVLAISLMVVASIMGVVPPKIIGNVIDHIRIGQLTETELSHTVLLLVGLAVLMYVNTYFWITMLYGNSVLLEKVMRGRFIHHLMRMKPSFYHRNRSGDLMALATNDVLAVSNTAGFGVMTLVHTVVGGTVVIVTMVTLISFKLMLAALLPLPILAFAIGKLGMAMRNRFKDSQASFGKMNDHALESISGMRVLRSYVQEAADVSAFDDVTRDVMRKNMKVALIGASFQPVISLIVGLSFSIGLGYGSYLVFQGNISLGQLVSFNIYLGQLIWPMIAFGEFINMLQRGTASVDRMDKTLAEQPDVDDPQEPIDVPAAESFVMRGLTFRYPGAVKNSLEQVSFRLEQSQTLGLVGRTGSGKSTLLKQLLRQYPIAPEKLFVSGVPIERIAQAQIAGWIGYVPQEHMLLSKTIRENVALGAESASEADIRRALDMAVVADDVEQMKDGLDTLIGENGIMLSGGQKQRVAIARALIGDPQVLILDDSLSAVDARTESAILSNIRRERQGKTTLIATHRLSAVAHADWILVLNDGKVAEEGTHEQLLAQGGWYKSQYDRQQLEAGLLGEAGDEADEKEVTVRE
jgi:ATP-binding cassette subfamily B protein